MGRDAMRLCGAQARRPCDGRRRCRLLSCQSGALQGAAHRCIRPVAENLHRQDPEIPAARAGQEPDAVSADFSLAGKRALVTGASRGLGLHFARVLAAAGADVALMARDRTALDKAVAAIGKATSRRAIAVAGDVTDKASVRAAVDQTETALGPLDILVNNAGIAVSKPLLEHDEADWDRVLDTNLKGAWLMAQEFAARRIADKRGGRIVNLASLLAFRTARNVPEYAAAKAGLVQLTRVLALELARHGIGVNALAPGYFETDMNRAFLNSESGQVATARIPLGRTGMAADLDGALLLLVSPAGGYITGAVIPVDGGHGVASI